MNTERNLQFLQNQLSNLTKELLLEKRQQVWFQQNGSPCQSTLAV